MEIEQARTDIARRTKKGLSFILASIVIWSAILAVWLLPIENVLAKNLFTFICTAPLVPLAFAISRFIKAAFSTNDNPLHKLGFLFSMNQLSYILIAMWAYTQASQHMVMILAVIFGAHLLPFSWLYRSRAYLILSIVIPLAAVTVDITGGAPYVIAMIMVVVEAAFAAWLAVEVMGAAKTKESALGG